MTNKQKQMLNLLKKNVGHYTAEDVFYMAKENGIDISLASTYRILNKMAEDKIIKRISNIKEDKDVYDVFVTEHEHLVCSKCGKVTDVIVDDLKHELEEKLNVAIDDFDLCIHYVCDECKAKGEKHEKI